jgi:hypothetical protein
VLDVANKVETLPGRRAFAEAAQQRPYQSGVDARESVIRDNVGTLLDSALSTRRSAHARTANLWGLARRDRRAG